MCGILALLFVVVPAIEIAVLLQVGQLFGLPVTLALIALAALVGGWLSRQQGLAALHKLQAALTTGGEVGLAVVEGALLLVAGVLMLTPGFVTDLVGLLLLLPPVRAPAARLVLDWVRKRAVLVATPAPQGWPGAARPTGRIIDVEAEESADEPRP